MGCVITSGERTISGEALRDRAARAAAGFAGLGMGEGGVVALLLRNDFALFEAANAAAMIGAFSVPINWHFGAEEVGYMLADSKARALVVHSDLLPAIADAVPGHIEIFVVPTPPEIAAAYGVSPAPFARGTDWNAWVESHEPAERASAPVVASTIVYTSGTTGRPKGVQRDASQAAAESAARAVGALFDLRPGVRCAVTGPMYHSALNGYGLGMAAAGGDVWLMPKFDAEGLLAMIERHRLTHLHLVPIMFVRLLKLPQEVRRQYDVSSLQHVVHAAAPCPIEIKRKMIDWWGPVIHEYFGSTETRMIASCNTGEWLEHPGTVGRILPEVELAILDDDRKPVATGVVGEIFARNRSVEDFTYTGDPEKRSDVDVGGLVTSGDVGFVDEDGFLYLSDRRRDMINSGGVNIYPVEIEGCLMEMDGVEDCAVFGIPDDEYGESVAAIVQKSPAVPIGAADVQDFVRARLARYKAPKLVQFVDQLPRDDAGKIKKRTLRDPFWQNAGRRI